MARKKTDIQRTKEYLNRYLGINPPRKINNVEARSILSNFDLEFTKIYNRAMEALLTEETRRQL